MTPFNWRVFESRETKPISSPVLSDFANLICDFSDVILLIWPTLMSLQSPLKAGLYLYERLWFLSLNFWELFCAVCGWEKRRNLCTKRVHSMFTSGRSKHCNYRINSTIWSIRQINIRLWTVWKKSQINTVIPTVHKFGLGTCTEKSYRTEPICVD